MDGFSMDLPAGARFVLERLTGAGFAAYVVGGCVRDAMRGDAPKDYDVCTSALPEETKRVFSDCRTVDTGLAHGTVTVIARGEPYEVTTFRVDGAYADHRHPDRVDFVRQVERDLARRDFTVNAMAYNPWQGLCDPFGGRADLRAGCIRCVGEPARRFSEDALRILRALRFAATNAFAIEAETARAARALAPDLAHVARERVTAELCKLLCGRAAGAVVRAFPDVLAQALPAPLCAEGLDAVPPEVALRLAHALHAAPDPGAALAALRLPKRTERAVRELIAHFGAPRPETPAQARRLLRDIGPERAAELARLRAWPPGALEEALARGDAYSIPQLAITGADLAAAGIPAGPGVGRLLRALLDGVVEGEIENERAALLCAAQRWNLQEEESCR